MTSRSLKNFFILFPVLMLLGITLTASCGNSPADTLPEPDNENSSGSENVLRVFVYNIHHGEGVDGEVNLERIAEVIGEKDPHLVALNEVDVGVERSGNVDTMEFLAEALGMEPVFEKNIITRQGGEYGNGILTNLPLLSSKNLLLDMSEDGEQRGLLQAETEFDEFRIVFMATHLDHQSDINRQVAVQQIIETKNQYPGMPVIAAGDFNAMPNDGIIGQMKVHFSDVWEKAGSGPGYTIPAPASQATRRIDYIFYTNEGVEADEPRLQPVHVEVINTDASDHLPVYAEFEVVYGNKQ